MVTQGADCKWKEPPEKIGEMTVQTLQRSIVPALPVICFLSGGSSEEDASLFLNAMNALPDKDQRPWVLTFSYGRALQGTVLKVWGGKKENVKAA